MTTRESLKNYCEAHKKEIIIGTVCLLIGVSYGKAKYGVRKKEMNFIKEFRRFKPDPVSGRKAIESLTKVQDGSNGYLVPVGDQEALSAAISGLLEKPELAEKMAENAIQRMKEFYPEQIYTKWDNYIHKFI